MRCRAGRASDTETIDSGFVPGRVKPKTVYKLLFTASPFDVQQKKQCVASTVCAIDTKTGGQVAA